MRIDGRTLSHETSETIRRMAVRRVRERREAQRSDQGYGLCRTTIYKWLRKARAAWRAGTALDQGHPGRPAQLTPRQKLQVRRWIVGRIRDSTGSTLVCGPGRLLRT